MDPIPQWVVIVSVVITLGDVVLSELHGTGMAFDRIEVITVPSVLAGSEWHAYPCQNRHAWLRSASPHSSQGVRMVERSCVSCTLCG